MNIIRKIKLKRAKVSPTNNSWANSQLDFGEPMFLHTTRADYLAVGNGESTINGAIVPNSTIKLFKAHQQDVVDNGVFHKDLNTLDSLASKCTLVKDDNDTTVYPYTVASSVFVESGGNITNVDNVLSNINDNIDELSNHTKYAESDAHMGAALRIKTTDATTGKYYLTGVKENDTSNVLYKATPNAGGTYTDGIYYDAGSGVLYGSAWNNDYAEKRKCIDTVYPGEVVVEGGHGCLLKSFDYNLPCAYVVSDTCGFVIGKEGVPVAVAGRVLVEVENRTTVHKGDALCSAPGGRAAKMTRHQIKKYPERILGIVTEVPDYTTWGNVDVRNRVWMKIK